MFATILSGWVIILGQKESDEEEKDIEIEDHDSNAPIKDS